MNKQHYRLVFNKLRGILMAVAEHIASSGKSTQETRTSGTTTQSAQPSVSQKSIELTLKPSHFAVLCRLGLVSLVSFTAVSNSAHADIIADHTAPANQRPVILNAANGVPLVNIQTPSAAGVSRNTYSQFDVNNNGVILNNSHNSVQTQLGGFVQGNPYMAAGTARIILNEVNSQNPSLLNGYVEVAGSSAQVVIANPAGISCNGCGFINANRATLTTGVPMMNGGDLIGYRVTSGVVNILGAGLDSSQSNYADIIARAVNVNASLFAQNLNVTTGTNQVNVNTPQNNTDNYISSVTPITPTNTVDNPTPNFAIDVAALGGMYAGKIHLIGTEAGVGVRNAGSIGASVGEINIDVNGNLTNTNAAHTASIASTTQTKINAQDIINTGGTLSAGQLLDITATSLTGDGKLLSGGDATIHLNSDYTHTSNGQLQAANNLSLTTTGNISNQANILAGNTLTLNAVNIENTAGSEISGLNTHINSTGTLTNRGLIDGSDTFIAADTVNNIGTGSIFGDHLAIQANTLLNDTETIVNSGVPTTTAAVIAARTRLDLGISDTITNREHAMLFSAGDIAIAGALDANHQATTASGQAQTLTLNNNSATIEALGNVSLNVADINNTNEHFSTQVVQVSNIAVQEYQLAPGDVHHPFDITSRYLPSEVTFYDCEALCITAISNGNDSDQFIRYDYTRTINETQVQNSDPSQIVAGGAMQVTSNNVLNDKSKIIAGSALTANIGTLTNTEVAGEHTITDAGTSSYFYRVREKGRDHYEVSTAGYNPAATIQAISLAPTAYLANTSPASVGAASGTTVATLTSSTLPNNSLFQTNPNANHGYLIETNPRFADYRTWLSSDYMINALSYDPATMTKRLGDGFYEQKLVREQVAQLTGRRFLTGYSNDEAEYQALMMNGVTSAKAFNLTPGIALSAAQIAQLTSDIVWLVEQTVTLPDGTQTQALVPQVYVTVKSGDLNSSGALISADSIDLHITGDLNNTNGTIAGRRLLTLNANNVNNLGGRLTANDVGVAAQNDLNNLGGQIDASNSLVVSAGHDINVISTTSTQTNAQSSRTNINRVAGLYVTGNQGLLVAIAGNDIHLDAAQIVNNGTSSTAGETTVGGTSIQAGRNLNLGTVTTSEQNNITWNSKNHLNQGNSLDNGTTIQTNGNIQLKAGNDANIKAASITSGNTSSERSATNTGGALTINAANNINLTAGQATQTLDEAHQTKSKGFLSSRTFTTQDHVNASNSLGSSLSADSITLNAGLPSPAGGRGLGGEGQTGNINVQGSNMVATNDTNLNAGNNITITAAQNTDNETHLRDVKKSGLLSSGGIGFTIGSRQLTNTNDTQAVTNTTSTVGSINGDVNINAGKAYTQTGSDILAPQGDVNITAQQVDINAASNSNNSIQTTKFKQTGITLAVTSPVISAIQTAQQMVQAASQIKDARMQALATGTTALSASNALDAIKAGQGDQFGNIATAGNTGADDMTHVREANGADQVGGINISISLGTSQNSSTTTQTSNNAQSSHVTAGNNINIKATGDQLADGSSNPDSGNINVIGSQVKAAHNVTLKAEDTINLHAAQNVDTLNSKNSGSSASLGVSFGTDGLLFTAGLSGSKGKAKGNDITYTETQIQSGNKTGDSVTLNSGKDTNLIGAQVTGNQVIANVGTNPLTGEAGQGNLNIQSLQDLSDFNSKQQSIGGSISVGYGKMGGSFNYSDSKTNSNYASVKEQSGIMAGDGGFQVNVNGNTDLKGAVIASSQAAIDNHKNSLTTQTLTTSNIENKADYKSSSTSIGGGYSTSGDGVGLSQDGKAQTGGTKVPGTTLPSLGGFSASLPVAMKASGNANSTTLSGISGSNISITNNQAQTALTGKDAIMTVASLNRDVKVVQSTDANGNTTTKTVDSQGNSTAHNLTPIYTEETKAQIEAGFEIIGAFTQQAGTFLNNRAKESTDAQKTIDAENKAAKAEGREPDDTLLSQQQQVLDNNATWSMGSTGRIALTAITAAFSGNVTSSGTSLIQSATVATLQSLGAQQIKALAIKLGGEGSPAHTALHAVLACAGAAATGTDCGTAALAASSGVVINTLLNSIEGKDADKLTASEKESRLNLITSLVTGVTAALGGDAAVANTAVTIETENNGLLDKLFIKPNPQTTKDINNLRNTCAKNINSCIDAVQLIRKKLSTDKTLNAADANYLGIAEGDFTRYIDNYLMSGNGNNLQSRLQALGMSAAMAASLISMAPNCKGGSLAICVVAALPVIDQLQSSVRVSITGNGGTFGSEGVKAAFAKAGIPLTNQQAEEAYTAILATGGTAAMVRGGLIVKAGNGEGLFSTNDLKPYSPSNNTLLGQANDVSCAAASCRMAANLHDVPEAYIRQAIQTDLTGTVLSNIPSGLKNLGFEGAATYSATMTTETIATATKNGASVIVNVRTETGGVHAIVVDSIKDGVVYIKDPWPVGIGSSYAVPVNSLKSVLTGKGVVIHQ
jgi:filamentous hemagglutinin